MVLFRGGDNVTRQKEFDEREALLKAMHLFWEQGYENTSLQNLVARMGVHRRSLYDTFGDKRSLFIQAFGQYRKWASATMKAEAGRGHTTKNALRFIFDDLIEATDDRPLGCLTVNAATELALRDPEVCEMANASFDSETKFLADLIRQGQQSGEIPPDKDANLLAASLQTTLIGIRVLSRTTTDKEKLHRIAEASIAVLDA